MSRGAPRYLFAIALHSTCQPGRPSPHGLGHDGSSPFDFFHRAKSSGSSFGLSPAGGSTTMSEVLEVPSGDIEVDVRPRMAEMAVVVRRRTADVHLDEAWRKGGERLLLPRAGVVQPDAHRRRRVARAGRS